MDKKYLLALILIILLGTTLRFYNISNESIWSDEGYYINQAKQDVPTILEFLRYDVNPPLYTFILKPWIIMFGDSELAVRGLSAIIGIATIGAIFILGKELFSKKVGLLASFITAISVFHIQYAQEARSYTLLALLTTVSYIFFFRLQKNQEKKDYILFAITSSLLLYTHIYGYFVLFIQNITYFIFNRKFKNWIITQFAIGITLIPYLPILFRQATDSIGANTWITPINLKEITYIIYMLAGDSKLFIILTGLLIISLIEFKYKNIAKLIKKRKLKNKPLIQFNLEKSKNQIQLLIGFIGLILIPIIISLTITTILFRRYTIPATIPLFILAGLGIYNLKSKVLQTLVIGLIVILAIPTISSLYNNPYKEDWRGVTEYLDNNVKDIYDRILFYPGFVENITYDYYTKTNKTTYQVTFLTRELTNEDIVRMSPMYGEYLQIFLVISHGRNCDNLIKELDNFYGNRETIKFKRIDVIRFYDVKPKERNEIN